ncbi:MAG: oxidoreductase, partial [Candidatus Dormibacteraeota bacterium]|nr:oxidoreductase [Candidatus Dormibacteraeota bacterium]
GHPFHVERLAAYWAEALGGPRSYSAMERGAESSMLGIHAGTGAGDDFGPRFVACFLQAADDVQLPGDPEFRASLREYIEWAVTRVLSYAPEGSQVPRDLAVARWSWDGPVE